MLKSPVMKALLGIWVLILIITAIMLTISNKNSAVLTESDYYQKGIRYDAVVEAKKNVRVLGDGLTFNYSNIPLTFSVADSTIDSVAIECMRFNNHKKDTTFILEKGSGGTWNQNHFSLDRGRWKITLQAFSQLGLIYFIEKDYFQE